MAKAFASQSDLTEKKITFNEIGDGLYAFTAEGDPNSGVIIGDDSVMVVEAQATPRLAQKVIDCIRTVTDKPISHVVLKMCIRDRSTAGRRLNCCQQPALAQQLDALLRHLPHVFSHFGAALQFRNEAFCDALGLCFQFPLWRVNTHGFPPKCAIRTQVSSVIECCSFSNVCQYRQVLSIDFGLSQLQKGENSKEIQCAGRQ